MNKSLSEKDFAEAFGTDEDEIHRFCGDLIKSLDFKYEVCSQATREKIFLDVIKKYDDAELSASGSHRLNDWRTGWGEILQEFLASGGDLKVLVPKDLRPNRPLRYKENYILPFTASFEHDFALVFRYWLFKKYCRDYQNIYEFGCGTGQNLAVMAGLFPEKRFLGMDWVPESQELLKLIAGTYGWQMEGHRFDFFKPNYELEILPNSLIYTSCAMEQIGGDYGSFLDYLLAKKPSLCVNVECIQELYDEHTLCDYVALRYHRRRNYLGDFLTRLRALEQEKIIEIIATKRMGFGSLYHEGYMYVIWKIL
ncbi:class I SAM-dependent methyltransferase [Patescibacteria group bacterium]|nr:class I SAM-dependent methyltransferase [Patescibacteria group bacterium]